MTEQPRETRRSAGVDPGADSSVSIGPAPGATSPDTAGVPGAVRIRQAWRSSEAPHAVVVVHVQTPELTVDEFRKLLALITTADDLASMVKRRLAYRGPA